MKERVSAGTLESGNVRELPGITYEVFRKPTNEFDPHPFKVVMRRESPYFTVAGTGMNAGEAYGNALAQMRQKMVSSILTVSLSPVISVERALLLSCFRLLLSVGQNLEYQQSVCLSIKVILKLRLSISVLVLFMSMIPHGVDIR